jgi:hypothetical protein
MDLFCFGLTPDDDVSDVITNFKTGEIKADVV